MNTTLITDNPGQRVYGFWDGDYTFHHVEYPDPELNFTFRVRIDNASPEERMEANTKNLNKAPEGWTSIRKATAEETDRWLAGFADRFPLRPQADSEALRFLKINGPTAGEKIPEVLYDMVHDLTVNTRRVVRDFFGKDLQLVRLQQGVYSLTADGQWLTALMK